LANGQKERPGSTSDSEGGQESRVKNTLGSPMAATGSNNQTINHFSLIRNKFNGHRVF